MVIREFGKENTRTILFFQGSCEPWQEFSGSVELLSQKYHVFLVTQDGHDPEDHTDFISVEKTVDDAVRWCTEHGIERLDAAYGLSFGGGMVARLLAVGAMPVKKAIIDAGTAPYQLPKWICRLICVRDYLMLKIGMKSVGAMKLAFPPNHFARDPENVDEEYEEIRQYLNTYSKKTVWNIFWSANNYSVPDGPSGTATGIQFWVGVEELKSRSRDLKWYKKYFPDMEVVKIPKMMHGELVLMHPQEFAERAFDFLEKE